MKNGVWREYKRNDEQSYELLYNDLKDSGKDWWLAKNWQNCYTAIHGTIDGEKSSGDVYVYYIYDNENYVPEFYFKVEDGCTLSGEEERNFIRYNGASWLIDETIDGKYFPELIKKLKEIDEKKNKRDIDKLEKGYEVYQRLLSLEKKEDLTEEELVFIYDRTTHRHNPVFPSLAKRILKGRNIQTDFDNMKFENKVKLFLAIKETEMADQLIIDSKEVLLALAQNRCLKQLENTTEEIINDKEYIMTLLEEFFNASSRHDFYYREIPVQYQTDLDILKLIAYKTKYDLEGCLLTWNNPQLREKLQNPEFSYQVLDSIARANMKTDYDCWFLSAFPTEVLSSVEEHILIGPEATKEREKLKAENIKQLKKQRDEVLKFRKDPLNYKF